MGFYIFEKNDMKKTTAIFFLLLVQIFFGQKLEFKTLLEDKISIRALQLWDNKVWYTGTDSKFGYVSLKKINDNKQMTILNEKKLQFRTLAQDKNYFYTINIESPAYFYQINKKTWNYKIVFKDTIKTAFYDAIHFVKKEFGFALSDPDKNLNLKFVSYNYLDKNTWIINNFSQQNLKFTEGEAAFAASNTNISSKGNYAWFATGGKISRIFRLDFNTNLFEVFDTPFIQGTSSQGIYSIDFYDEKFGIAVGGDYTKQAENINNIATTNDGGETWQIQASGKNGGYKTCVKIRPKSKGKDIIAVGDQNIEFSNDFGKTWTTISEEKNLYVCEWIDENTLVFAGKDRILKAEFRN